MLISTHTFFFIQLVLTLSFFLAAAFFNHSTKQRQLVSATIYIMIIALIKALLYLFAGLWISFAGMAFVALAAAIVLLLDSFGLIRYP